MGLGGLAGVHDGGVACDLAASIQIHFHFLHQVLHHPQSSELASHVDWVKHVTVEIVRNHVVFDDDCNECLPVVVLDCFDKQVQLLLQLQGLHFSVLLLQLYEFFEFSLLLGLLVH